MPTKMEIKVIANCAQGRLVSGGDKIFIELSRQWVKLGHRVEIFLTEEGLAMCRRAKLSGVDFKLWPVGILRNTPFAVSYLFRIFNGVIRSFLIKAGKETLIYSASDFWPDTLPALLVKLRSFKIKWAAGFYLFAPKPWAKDNPYQGKRFLIGLIYWLTQIPIFWLVRELADFVFITSLPDVKKFITEKKGRNRILIVKGGVDLESVEKISLLPVEKRKYDACFVGRFHEQKGVLELIDIWDLACRQRPGSKLVMIGDGPLFDKVKKKITKLGLVDNIFLPGFIDGPEKYQYFRQSKIFVHPATYDSGGMAAAEAMAWGLPAVGFNLASLKDYYPKGMVKVKCSSLHEFSRKINRLLMNKKFYQRLSKEAVNLVNQEFDWSKKARLVIDLFKAKK